MRSQLAINRHCCFCCASGKAGTRHAQQSAVQSNRRAKTTMSSAEAHGMAGKFSNFDLEKRSVTANGFKLKQTPDRSSTSHYRIIGARSAKPMLPRTRPPRLPTSPSCHKIHPRERFVRPSAGQLLTTSIRPCGTCGQFVTGSTGAVFVDKLGSLLPDPAMSPTQILPCQFV